MSAWRGTTDGKLLGLDDGDDFAIQPQGIVRRTVGGFVLLGAASPARGRPRARPPHAVSRGSVRCLRVRHSASSEAVIGQTDRTPRFESEGRECGLSDQPSTRAVV